MKTRTIRKTFEGQTIKNCAYCGMIFYAKSNRAMYCTNSHKSLHWLEKQKDKKPQITFEAPKYPRVAVILIYNPVNLFNLFNLYSIHFSLKP